jgi:hypothetical protein
VISNEREVVSQVKEEFGLQLIIHQFAGIRFYSIEKDLLLSDRHRLKRLGDPDIHLQLFDGLTANHGGRDGLSQSIAEEVFY